MGVISCGIVIVRQDDDEDRYLLLRSFSFFEPGPKGRREEGETDLQAALRECREETCIMPEELEFRWGTDHIETEPYGKSHKVVRYFLARTRRTDITLPINPELNRAEHNEYKWLSYEEANKLLNPRLQRVLSWARSKLNET